MNEINQLFFELIQVAIGTRMCLSHTPSADEWGKLYSMAKKQSLVGVCFAGVQKLSSASYDNENEDENNHPDNSINSFDSAQNRRQPYTINLPEMLYLTWMGMAAKIQQRNEVVNRQCVDLQKRLSADGLRSVIMKGQGVAQIYPEHLRGLRQSGDIDVWVLSNEGESESEHIARVVNYAKRYNSQSHFSGKHIDLAVFVDTEVELHVTPAKMNCPWHQKRLGTWFQEVSLHRQYQDVSLRQGSGQAHGLRVPNKEFNIVYILLHCYDHLLFEGVGLRQIMDYYFVLLNASTKGFSEFQKVSKLVSSLGLDRFASAMFWVVDYVFGDQKLSETMKLFETMGIKPNEKEGRFLLNEIMTGGNFGKYGKDGVMEGHAKGKVAFFLARMKRNWRFLTHYPSEVLWAPYAMLRHWMWKRTVKI